MLRWRLLSAAVVISLLLGFLHLDFHHADWLGATGAWLLPVLLAFTILATQEVLALFRARDWHPSAWAVQVGSVLVAFSAAAPIAWDWLGREYPPDCPLGRLGWPLVAFALSVAGIFLAEMARYREPGRAILHVALGSFAVAYIGLMLSFLALLRLFHSHHWGMAALLSLIVVVKVSDTGAYFVGRMLGKHKLAPILSPKKTIEGAVGGLVAGCGASFVFFQWIAPWLAGESAPAAAWWGWLTFGIVATSAGMVGDLAESLLKRDVGQKDSSSWLPGLGGILDTIDSLLLAAPAVFLCWVSGIVGPSS